MFLLKDELLLKNVNVGKDLFGSKDKLVGGLRGLRHSHQGRSYP